MCGISGHLNFDRRPADRMLAEAMNTRLAHRGPDGADVYTDGPVALAHRRLAIIDLAGGRQPMSNESGSIWLVANGEIYNYRELRADLVARGHRFRTNSDCETIVHGYAQWGIEVVNRLRGMFAFGLWDATKQQLVLARDRVGIKPLCYSINDRRIAFASELQALQVLPDLDREVDLDALDHYLHLQYIPAPRSIYRGARKLLPAHTLVIGADGHVEQPRRYWQLRWHEDSSRSEAEWVEALDAALQDSVRAHLVADVPFGAFLSGGVDSSTVVGYAARELTSQLQTYTVGFDTPEYDEREPARAFSRLAGTDHHEQEVGLDALGLLPSLVHHYGEPFADSSAVCTWRVCEAARRHVPMVLSGDGGDEVFAGYSYFAKLVEGHPPLRGRTRKLRRAAGDLLRRVGALTAAPSLADDWYGRSPWFSESQRKLLWRTGLTGHTAATRCWNADLFATSRRLDVLSRCQQADIDSYLPNNNLAKVDIASMAHGLEVRVPLLDHLLLETVARMPASMRLREIAAPGGGRVWCGKYVLKQAATRFYPREMLTTPKRGFSVPVGQWLAGEYKQEVRQRLLDPSSSLDEWFAMDQVGRLLDEHGATADHGHRLWSLLVLAQWRQGQQP